MVTQRRIVLHLSLRSVQVSKVSNNVSRGKQITEQAMNKARAILNDAIAILDAIPYDVSLPNNAHFGAASTSIVQILVQLVGRKRLMFQPQHLYYQPQRAAAREG